MSHEESNSVDVVFDRGLWLVRVREGSGTAEVSYQIEEHARSFAAGQAIRLGVQGDESGADRAA